MEVFLLFLRLGFGADLGRARHVLSSFLSGCLSVSLSLSLSLSLFLPGALPLENDAEFFLVQVIIVDIGRFLIRLIGFFTRLFLVGAFSFKEKSPTITVASFFFRQTTELIAYVPLFTETDKFTQAKFHQCKLTAKGPPFRFLPFLRNLKTGRLQRVPPFNFFSALCEFFFRKFSIFQKSPPFGFFDILQQKIC